MKIANEEIIFTKDVQKHKSKEIKTSGGDDVNAFHEMNATESTSINCKIENQTQPVLQSILFRCMLHNRKCKHNNLLGNDSYYARCFHYPVQSPTLIKVMKLFADVI